MRFAVCSDEPYAINEQAVRELEARGHEVVRFGSLASGKEEPWAEVGRRAAEAVASGECDEGVFFCWTGTGISIAANKVPGVRAALCTDAQTARGARIWNHANVLALSNRLTSPDVLVEILDAWLATPPDDRGAAGVAGVAAIERDYARR
ncbi:MAG: RpiB/LacA/LacB family sugar-phosphate isomerase [Deltaproteobacteria bacterium]|nr:MAG: RpiB/LacA/LacB family sugar-phosphate isomerase [Deltaproteobacteria bacterium]